MSLCDVMEGMYRFVLFSSGHRGGGARTESKWLAVLWKIGVFYLACVSVRGFPLLLLEAVMGEQPAMPGKCSRPRRRNRDLVLVLRDGTLLAVLKAPCGEGSCRLSGCFKASSSFRRCCEEDDERAGNAAGVEDDALCVLGCNVLFCRGPFAKFSCAVKLLHGLSYILVCSRGVSVKSPWTRVRLGCSGVFGAVTLFSF